MTQVNIDKGRAANLGALFCLEWCGKRTFCDRTHHMTSTVNLGPEYDLVVTNALLHVLREMGAQEISRNWGVGGSQEVNTLQFELDGCQLTVEAETYVGLSLSGESQTIQAIAKRVREIV